MKLSLLIADDQKLIQMLLSAIGTQRGYRILLASNGREAVEQFVAHAPDLVLMDVMMPEMNGIEATAIIKSMCRERWVPVLILSVLSEVDDIVRGMKAGADDYIIKPLQIDILNAKLNNFERGIAAQRQLETQNEELRRYRFKVEDEKRIASHLMQSLVDIKRLHIPGVEWWLQAADAFSGDILAAECTPSGMLHVMLGDGTGHGLAAALSAQPLPEIFYAMTARGHTIGSIAQEINRRIGRMLPVDRFFAAILVAVDSLEQIVEVWNGGNPPVLLIDQDGSPIHAFTSQHLSLGIIRNGDFSSATESMHYPTGAQLVMMSDGLLDTCQAEAADYSQDCLLRMLTGIAPEKRLASIRQYVLDHLAGTAALDDISLFVISTDLLDHAGFCDGQPLLDTSTESEDEAWCFRLKLNGIQLRRMNQEVVPFMMGALDRLSLSEKHSGTLFLILSELFNNSLDHGLLELDSSLKNAAEGFEQYLDLRSSRLAALDKQAVIELEIEMTTNCTINIMVRDSGNGFDHVAALRQTMETHNHHGRGLILVRGLATRLDYPGSGNEARACITLDPQ